MKIETWISLGDSKNIIHHDSNWCVDRFCFGGSYNHYVIFLVDKCNNALKLFNHVDAYSIAYKIFKDEL